MYIYIYVYTHRIYIDILVVEEILHQLMGGKHPIIYRVSIILLVPPVTSFVQFSCSPTL